MRIAVFSNTYLPSLNGVANVVEAYRKSLVELGHEVYIFAPGTSAKDDPDDHEHILRFPSFEAPTFDYSVAMPFSLPIMRVLHGVSFDIVHTHHPLWVGVWGQWFAHWANLPLVTTVHTEYQIYSEMMPLPSGMVEGFLNRRVVKYCNKCDMVTTPVPSMREKLQGFNVATPIELIPNPTDLSFFVGANGMQIRQSLGIDPDDTVIGYVGRLSPEKNLPFVLRAATMIIAEDPTAHVLIVGGGPALENLRTAADELGITDRTHFTGEVPYDRIPDHQAALDVFLTASLSETQPLAYTEAMAVGTPIVAVKAPGSSDMIQDGHNGLLVSHEEGPEGMARAVSALLKDRQMYDDIRQAGMKWVERYDIGAATQKLLKVYERAQSSFEA
ncbi:MAG: glycosyltransferase [Armatimonadota bacterium]